MADPLDSESELIPFAARDEREWIQSETVSPADKERLLVELRRRLAVWRSNLKPTREQLLQVTHEQNRIHARLDGGNAQFWKGLDADWRRKQKPANWEPAQDWSPRAHDWLEAERRAGRVFNNEKEAEDAYVASQRLPFANPSQEWLRRDRINRAIQSGGRPDPEDLVEEAAEEREYQRKLVEAFREKELEHYGWNAFPSPDEDVSIITGKPRKSVWWEIPPETLPQSDKMAKLESENDRGYVAAPERNEKPSALSPKAETPKPLEIDYGSLRDRPWHKHRDLVVAIVAGCVTVAIAILLWLVAPTNRVIVLLGLLAFFGLLAFSAGLVGHYFGRLRIGLVVGILLSVLLVGGLGWYVWPEPITKPEVTLRFIYPNEPSMVIDNPSGSIVRDIKWTVALWNMDLPERNDPLPIPVTGFDWLRPHEESGPQNLFTSPLVVPLLKPGDRLVGSAAVTCPDCLRGHTYIVYIVWGSGGWFSEIKSETTGRLYIPKNLLKESREQYFKLIETTVLEKYRLPIGEK